jgi:hypothetical protein
VYHRLVRTFVAIPVLVVATLALLAFFAPAPAHAADVAPFGGCCRCSARSSQSHAPPAKLGAISLALLVPAILRRRRR